MKVSLITLLIFLSFICLGQSEWTLDRCIEHAYNNNLQLKIQELAELSAKNSLIQSKAAFLPNINASANRSYTSGRSVDPFTNEFSNEEIITSDNYSLSSNLVLFQGFRNHFSLKQNNLNFIAAKYDLEKARNDMSLNIASAYLQVLLNKEVYRAAELSYQQSKRQTERTKSLLEAQTIALGVYLEIEAQLARDEFQLTNAQNQLNMSLLNLSQLLDLNPNQPFDVAEPNIDALLPANALTNPNDIFNEAKENMPQIKAEAHRLEAAKAGLKVAQSARSPRLLMGFSYSTGYSDARKSLDGIQLIDYRPSGDIVYDNQGNIIQILSPNFSYSYSTRPYNNQIRDNANRSLGFSLSIPIFNNWQVNHSVAQSKISLLNSTYSNEIATRQLEKEIYQAHADAQAAYTQYQMAQKVLKASEEAWKNTENRFENGLINPVEYNLSKTNLDRAKSDAIQAKYLMVFREKVLDFYLGKKLTF